MFGQAQILNQRDLEGYKKIADSFANVDDSRINDSIEYFKTYIQKNKESTNPEIAKKVLMAQKLVKVLDISGALRNMKGYMNTASESIASALEDAKNEDPVRTEFSFGGIQYMGSLIPYQHLDEVNHDEILTAYKEFMEGDDFAEYKKDSPVRFIGEYLNACASAHRGFTQIEANVNRNEFNTVIGENQKDIIKTNLHEIQVIDQVLKDNEHIGKNVAIAYNSDIDLHKLESDLQQTENAINQREIEIAKLQERYVNVYPKEAEAKKMLPELARTVTSLEKQEKDETLSAISGEARKQANKDKEKFREALSTLLQAHTDIKNLRKENPNVLYTPFALVQETEKKYNAVNKDYEDFKKLIDTDAFVDKLIKDEPNKELAKATLTDAFYFFKKNKHDEIKWNNIQQKYFQYKLAFGNNPEYMNYLIAGDEDLMRAGYKKLESDLSKPGVKDGKMLLDMAIQFKKEILKEMDDNGLFESYFSYDGKTSQEEFLKQLDKKIQAKVDEFPNERSEYPLLVAYENYIKTKETADDIQKQLNEELQKGEAANKDTILNLSQKLSAESKKNMEHWTLLKNAGIENPDNVNQIMAYGQKRATKNDDDINEKRLAVSKAKKTLDLSRKYANQLTEAVKLVSKSELADSDPGLKCLLNIINHTDPEYDKLPDTTKYLDEVNAKYSKSVENNLKNYAKETSEKLAVANEKFKKMTAVAEKNESQQILEQISQKKAEVARFKDIKQFCENKKTNLTKVIQDYKNVFAEPFAKLEERYADYPKLTTKDEYWRIFNQIESFREDFDKCRRADYINGSKRNSTEYENIKNALDQFKNWEEFQQMHPLEISGKLDFLATAAENYKTEKLRETRPFWSPQRRYRLGYADRIRGFANTESATLKEYISFVDEEKQLENKNAAYTLAQTANPANVSDNGIIVALTRPKGIEEELECRNNAKNRIGNVLQTSYENAVKAIRNEQLDDELFKKILQIIDIALEQKDKYQNPELIAQKGISAVSEEIIEELRAENLKNRCNEFDMDIDKVQKYEDIIKNTSKEDILNCKNGAEFLKLIQKNAQKEPAKKELNQMIKTAKEIENIKPSNMKKIEEGDAGKLLNENIKVKSKENTAKKPAPKPFNA